MPVKRPEPTPDSVWEIPRNDVRACVRYYEAHGVTEDEVAVMLQLQDDPGELKTLAQRWTVRRS